MPEDDPTERFDLYDERGQPLARSKPRGLVHRDGDWHRSLHLWVILESARGFAVLLQRRSLTKDTHPGKVDVSVAGHLRAGEGVEQALREAHEEIGLQVTLGDVTHLEVRRREDLSQPGCIDRELQEVCFVVTPRTLESFVPDRDEVAGLLEVPLASARALCEGLARELMARELSPGGGVRDVVLGRDELLLAADGYFERVLAALDARLHREDVYPLAHLPMQTQSFTQTFLSEGIAILQQLDVQAIEAVATGLAAVRDGENARLFILGVGGSAGHASHAINDFRKICGFEAYTPTDNVSELTARINDEGWDTCFSEWLKGSRLRKGDALLVFSVGGGNREKNVSVNLVKSLELAREVGAKIFGIVGRDGGYTKQVADACVVIPTISADRTTPHTEGFAAVVWHLLVSHPRLQREPTKWESVK